MKIIDIIIKMHEKEKLPKKIKHLQKIFIYKYGGYYTEIGENIFNFISEYMLDVEVEVLKK